MEQTHENVSQIKNGATKQNDALIRDNWKRKTRHDTHLRVKQCIIIDTTLSTHKKYLIIAKKKDKNFQSTI